MSGFGLTTRGPGGIVFRSRLEARWAAFFDLVGWPWQYEPDLGLKGWIPDFMVTSGAGLLVEVKPVMTLSGFAPHYRRVEASGTVAPVLLLGAALTYPDSGGNNYMGAFGWTGGFGQWDWRAVTLETVAHKVGTVPAVDLKTAQRAWVRASNELQWRRG